METAVLADPPLADVLAAVGQILRTAGEHLVAGVSVSRTVVSLQPVHLDQGATLAAALGLESFLEHRLTVPAVADWSGTIAGLEVHVRGTRPRPGALR